MTATVAQPVSAHDHAKHRSGLAFFSRWTLTGLGSALLAMLAINVWITSTTRGLIFDDMDRIGVYNVGLVLGTSPYTRDGHPNLLFEHRMQAAAALYAAGKVRHLLISGANPDDHYNEPRKMYQALRALGVPGRAITLDYAGFRTLDSIVRARRIFGLTNFVIISQRYHDYRALFLTRHYGIDAIAYVPAADDRRQPLRTAAREYLARVKAVLDVFVLHTRPRFLGPERPIDVRPWVPDNALVRNQTRQNSDNGNGKRA
jgi:SanA protein